MTRTVRLVVAAVLTVGVVPAVPVSGRSKPIPSAAAPNPARVAVIVDTSDAASPALNHLRTALQVFADTLPPPHELLLVSAGRQVRVRLPPTADRKKFKDTAAGLFPDGGATPLMDALLETDDRFLKKAEDRWPVFVIVTSDGTEGSAGANERRFNEWVRGLPRRGVAAHAIVMKYRGGGMPEIVANEVVQAVRGYYEFINTSNSLPDKMKAIAERIKRDYEHLSGKDEDAAGEAQARQR